MTGISEHQAGTPTATRPCLWAAPVQGDEPHHQEAEVVAPRVGVAPRRGRTRLRVADQVHHLGGRRVHQRLDEAHLADVLRQQHLHRRGELERPGERAEQPTGDGDHEQPAQQPDVPFAAAARAGCRGRPGGSSAPAYWPSRNTTATMRPPAVSGTVPVRVGAERGDAGHHQREERQPPPEPGRQRAPAGRPGAGGTASTTITGATPGRSARRGRAPTTPGTR